MAQQTAVAILEEKLKTYLSWSSFLEEDFEQSKAMEKEQIVNAWDKRVFRGTFVKGWHIETQNGDEYYNETYNK